MTSPAGAVKNDPYFDGSHHGAEATNWNDTPPAVAQPASGGATLMHLYVPSSRTEVDFGAGVVPGIRMATDPHAHITARDTLTTISLGTAAGDGIGAGPAGLNILTMGVKRESVELSTEENYKNKKTEVILGAHAQKLFDKHDFGVKGDATYQFESNKSETVHGSSFREVMGEMKETIHGDRSFEMKHKNEKVYGDWKWNLFGNWESVTAGKSNSIFLGEQSTTSVGVVISVTMAGTLTLSVGGGFSASLAPQRSYNAASKFDLSTSNSVSINNAMSLSRNNFSGSKSTTSFSQADTTLDRGQLYVKKATGKITSAEYNVLK